MEDTTSPEPVDLSNEEDNTLDYLAGALKQEIARKRALKNSRSEGCLIPAYLTGFNIPTRPQNDSQASLTSAMDTFNINRSNNPDKSPKSSKTGGQGGKTSVKKQPTAGNSRDNPFKATTAQAQAEEVSDHSIGDPFYSCPSLNSITESQFLSQVNDKSQTKVDSSFDFSSGLNVNKPECVSSDSVLTQVNRRSTRLKNKNVSKTGGRNSSVNKVSGSKIKVSKAPSSATGKKGQKTPIKSYKDLFKVSSPSLTQLVEIRSQDTFLGKLATKRAANKSPDLTPASKLARAKSPIRKQSFVFNTPPLPRREKITPRRRGLQATPPIDVDVTLTSETRGPEPDLSDSHARALTGNVNKPSHGADLTQDRTASGGNHSNLSIDIFGSQPTPSATCSDTDLLNKTVYPRTPVNTQNTLNVHDILSQNPDPLIASQIEKMPVVPDDILDGESSASSSDESIAICSLYNRNSIEPVVVDPEKMDEDSLPDIRAPKSLRQTDNFSQKNKNKNGDTSSDPVLALMKLCNEADFRQDPVSPTPMPIPIPTSSPRPLAQVNNTGLAPLTDWSAYIDSISANPFGKNNFAQKTKNIPSTSPNTLEGVLSKSKNRQITVTNDGTISVSIQDRPNAPIYDDAMSIWRDFRNALAKDVTYRLRLNHLETMLADGLVPAWTVSYDPPSGLLTNATQAELVVEVRKKIWEEQLSCTMELTRRELEKLGTRVAQLKDNLHALYQLEAAADYSFDAAVNAAVVQADKTRMNIYNDLSRRITAIREAPQAALWLGIPDDIPRPENAIPRNRRAQEPAPQVQGGSGQAQAPPRSRSAQRSPKTNQAPRPKSQGRFGPPPRPKAQKFSKNKSNKGNKGQGKRSTPYERNNQGGGGPFRQPRTKYERFYNHCANFFLSGDEEEEQ